MDQNQATQEVRPVRTTLIPISGIRTPHSDLLYQLLNAHMALKKSVLEPQTSVHPLQMESALDEPHLFYVPKAPPASNDIAKWKLQKLELLFADSFGKRPPTTMDEIYQMIAAQSGSLG